MRERENEAIGRKENCGTRLGIIGSTEKYEIGGHSGDIEFGFGIGIKSNVSDMIGGVVESFNGNGIGRRSSKGKTVTDTGHIVGVSSIKLNDWA